MREAVRLGAAGQRPGILLVQTNNATFGYTAESTQQLAISRLRAIEHGRPVAHVSTVGVSAVITPDGALHQPTELFTAAAIIDSVQPRSGLTPADRWGPWVEVASIVVLLALVVAGRWRTRPAVRVEGHRPLDQENHARA